MDTAADQGMTSGGFGVADGQRLADRDLGAWLIERGKLDADALARIRTLQTHSPERLDVLLLELGLVAESDLVDGLSSIHGFDVVSSEQLMARVPPPGLVSSAFLAAADAAIVDVSPAVVRLAMVDPSDDDTIRTVATATRRAVVPMVAAPSLVRAVAAKRQASEAADPRAGSRDGTSPDADARRLEDLATGAPAVRLLNSVLGRAVREDATDVHLQPDARGLVVRYRVDGVLVDGERVGEDLSAALTSRAKVLAGMDIAERRLPQDGRLSVGIEGRALDVRVATLPTAHGEGVVLRLLDTARAPLDLEGLGFTATVRGQFETLLAEPHGVVLVTGPTGSGKSTTLQAAMRLLNRGDAKLVSIEDPVEYRIDGIDQVSVRAAHGLGFADALRATLRYDPDVIMLGEMRDAETAEVAIQAALTGHKVLSTLHTNDAPGAITRLVDLGIPAFLVSSTLQAVLAQRLVRTLCDACAQPAAPPSGLSTDSLPETNQANWREAVGCEQCKGTGYRGRSVVHELMVVDDAVRDVLRGSADATLIRRTASERGMVSLLDDGLAKARVGITSVAEVFRVSATGATGVG